MKKFTRYQKQHDSLLNIFSRWFQLEKRYEEAAKVFGMDHAAMLTAMKESGLDFSHPEIPEQDWFEAYVQMHANETTCHKYRLKIQDAAERGRLTDIIVRLQKTEGYDGGYNRDGRVNREMWLKEIGHDVPMDTIKYWSETIYDDTCGRGGGHHTPWGVSTKAFAIAKAVQKLLDEEVLVPIQ